MTIQERTLDETCDGQAVALFTLENDRGVRAQLLSYGGTLVSLTVPDREGRFADIALGFDDLAGYQGQTTYAGAIIGRCANRTAGAAFTLDGVAHRLTANDGPNHLHGGHRGFDKVVWKAAARTTPAGPELALSYTSPDGEQGYPGTLEVEVVYTLTHDNALGIAYRATCDRETIVNLTNHTYWNLAGHGAGSILDHQLAIAASRFVPVGPGLIPTGELRAVAGTPFDFRRAAAIGARIGDDDDQLRLGGGYDHSYAIDGADGTLRHAARVVEPTSGRVLEVATTEPALQLYTGNFFEGERGKDGAVYARRTGFALEAQQFPDAPNQPAFPSVTLRSGARYQSATLYRFLVEAGNLMPHGVPADRGR